MTGKLKDIVDISIPTTQVGQYPKPSWYKYSIETNEFSALATSLGKEFIEAFRDASRVVVADQEEAGLDILTDGGLRFDKTGPRNERLAGWSTNNLAYMAGARRIKAKPTDTSIIEAIVGRDVVKAAAELCSGDYPQRGAANWVVEDDLGFGRLSTWTDTFKVAQSTTKKPLKFSAPSAAMAAVFAVNHSAKKDRDVYFDFFKVQNKALKELVDAGCKIIQLDYPFGLTHWAANTVKVKNEIWHDLIEAANEEIKGVNAHIWYHFCFGAPVLWGPEAPPMKYSIAETYKHMAESKCDLLQSEAANTKGAYLESELLTWKEHCPEKEFAVGAVTPYTGLETSGDVDRIVQTALKHVPPDRLSVTSDEGLAGHGAMTREEAYEKMLMIVAAVKKARKSL
jgi:5-methyltetrahydropteroyltriglutamate--homocysteine methyltransferase